MTTQITQLRPTFRSNPYRILRLSADANPAEVQARYAEARVEAQLEGGDQNDLLDELLRAHSELLDTRSRWKHETTWFYEPPDCVFDGNVLGEHEILESYQKKALLPGEEGVHGKHDLSNWLILLASHSGENIKEFAVRALVSWNELLGNPDYIRKLEAVHGNHLPTSDQIWDVVVQRQFSAVARDEANQGNADSVVALIEAFQESGRTWEEVNGLANDALQQLRATVQESRALAQANTELMNNRTITPMSWAEIVTTPALKLKTVLSAIDESETEASSVIAECTATLDGAASDIREAAIGWFNDENSVQTAIMLLDKAMEVVATEFRWERLSEEQDELRYSNAMNEMVRHVEGKRWHQALEAAQLALRVAPDEESRGTAAGYVRQLFERTKQRNDGLYKILGTLLFIGLVVGCNILVSTLGDDDSPRSTTPISNPSNFSPSESNNPPLFSPATNTDSLSRQRLESQIDNNKRKLDALISENERLIVEYDSICPVNNCRLSDRDFRRASQIEDRTDEISSEYERLRRATNTLIAQYNRTP